MSGGEARGQNLEHVHNVVFLRYSFLEVHILTTTVQKAFILQPQLPCRVSFHSMTLNPRVHARGDEARGQNLVHVHNVVFLQYKFVEVHILTATYQKALMVGP